MTNEAGPNRQERNTDTEPRIYVASLSDYNAGRLHGVWLDADTLDVLEEGVAAMLAASPEPGAEEYAVHDYEGFGPLNLSEYESLEVIAAVAAGIAEHGLAFAAWADQLDSLNLAELAGFEDGFHGEWESRTAYTDSILDDCGIDLDEIEAVPESMRRYLRLDMEAWLHDCEVGGELHIVEHADGIWVFVT